jgi:hypothetical protein
MRRQVACWHFSDVLRQSSDVRCWGVKPTRRLNAQTSHFDPQRTLATCARNYAGMGALRSRAVWVRQYRVPSSAFM